MAGERTPLGWPMPFHNAQLTAVSPFKGDIKKPRLAWTWNLGLGRPEGLINATRTPPVLLDLSGDGISEKIACEYDSTHFSVSNGADDKLLWSADTEQPITEQMFSVADANADGKLDLCLVTHYRAEVYDGSTGKRLYKIPWDVGRNYGFSIWSNFDEDAELECLVLSDYTVHVDCLDIGPGDQGRHLWSTIYRHNKNENAAWDFAVGRRDLRYLYRSVGDFDGDGRVEAAFMVYNLEDRRRWRTLLRALPDGRLMADQEDIFLYGIEDANGDGKPEIFASQLHTYGTMSFGPLSVWNFQKGKLTKTRDLGFGRFVLARDYLLPNTAVFGVKGTEEKTVLLVDLNQDGNRDFIIERDGNNDGVADSYEVLCLDAQGQTTTVMTFSDPEQRFTPSGVELQDGIPVLRGYDLKSSDSITFQANGKITAQPQARGWTFFSEPVAGDLDGDGRCEIVVQNSDGWIEVLRVPGAGGEPVLLWKRRGWGMNPHSGYTRPGTGVVLADLNGDGKSEVLFAGISREGWATLTVVDSQGKTVWEHSIAKVTPDWPDCGVDKWTVGQLNDDDVLDCIVQYHDLGHSSGKMRGLDGRDGRQLWEQIETDLEGYKRPMTGAYPVLVDFDKNGSSDIAFMPEHGLSGLSAANGEQLIAVRFWPPEPDVPDIWRPRGSNAPYATQISANDVDGDGVPEIFFNDRLTQAGLRLWPNVEQLWVVGEPHPPATAVTFRAEDNPLLFDFDDDGRIEFCAFHWQDRLVVHDALSGKVKGEFKLPATPTTRASAADVDGDGRSELLYGAGNTVHVVLAKADKDGRLPELWSYTLPAASGKPIFVNLDESGQSAVLVPAVNAHLYCLMSK